MVGIDRRLAELELRLAVVRPQSLPDQVAWLRWASEQELNQLEELYRAVEAGAREPTEADWLLCVEVEARATRAMLASELPAVAGN